MSKQRAYPEYIRREYCNAVAGPRPVAITRATNGMYYCEDRFGKVLAGRYSTEREATRRARALAEKGRR